MADSSLSSSWRRAALPFRRPPATARRPAWPAPLCVNGVVVRVGRVLGCVGSVLAFAIMSSPAGAASGQNVGAAPPPTQKVLPFTGLDDPGGVAVDKHGDVFVSDSANHRVLELHAHASTPVVVAFSGLAFPDGVAVDEHGDVFVSDTTECEVGCPSTGEDEVLELAAHSDVQTVLPFTGLHFPRGIAVDKAGDIIVVDGNNNRVLELAAGTSTPVVLPFTGLTDPS